jgi:hypothetical protein
MNRSSFRLGQSRAPYTMPHWVPAGRQEKLGQPAPQIISILSLVSAALGFSLVPDRTRQIQVDGVVYRAIRSVRSHGKARDRPQIDPTFAFGGEFRGHHPRHR